jgi:hypothetical protein
MECEKHKDVEGKLDELLGYSRMIIAALYGKLGDLDGDGIGLIARVHQHDTRIKELEERNEKTGATIKEVVIQWGPSALMLVIAIGMLLKEKGVI